MNREVALSQAGLPLELEEVGALDGSQDCQDHSARGLVDETIYLYLDASALVKRYISEVGSEQVRGWITSADKVVTGLITRVEVAAAIARAQRMKIIIRDKSKLSSSAGSAR